jgi:hypothetical protein
MSDLFRDSKFDSYCRDSVLEQIHDGFPLMGSNGVQYQIGLFSATGR